MFARWSLKRQEADDAGTTVTLASEVELDAAGDFTG